MKRIILSQRVPDKTLSCGAINISPYKAMEISLGEGSTMFMDSLLVEYADEEEPAFHDWLLFHSFLLNDTYPIEGFNNIHPSSIKESGEVRYKIDFDNVTEQVYQCTKELAEKIGAISYTNQYKAYLHLSQGDKDAIRNTLINLERPFERHNQPQILDPSFWNLMPSYSAIEYTVGKQIPCPSSVQCTEEDCFFRDKTAPSHNPRPYTEHISSYLKSRGASDKNVNEYMDIIKLVYANLRNNIVHNSLMPISMPSEQEEDGTIIHDLEKIKAGFKTDSISMMSLSLALQSVARIMVLDKVFLTGTFTEVAWLKSFKFTGHTENKPS